MKKLLAVTLLSMLSVSAYAATVIEPSFLADNRIKDVLYSEEDLYTINAKYGYQTNIVFGQGEEIQTISVGDRSMWQIIPSGNRLFIRPMQENVKTNMTVITDRHSYQFDLHSVAQYDISNVYVIRFVYPTPKPPVSAAYAPPMYPPRIHTPPPPPAPQLQPPPPPLKVPPSAIRHYAPPPLPPTKPATSTNMNYTYSGSDTLAPLQVYDNGHSTFMRYRTGQPLPGVYMLDKNGARHAVSYIVKGSTVVIPMIASAWLLENTDGNVQVYNEAIGEQ